MEKDEIHLHRLPAAAPWGPRKFRGGEGAGMGCALSRRGDGLRVPR